MTDLSWIEPIEVTAPLPVAVAMKRVRAARTFAERLDATFKAAEVIARYVATATLASYRVREVEAGKPCDVDLEEFKKNLSFGDFLTICDRISKSPVRHPLAARLAATVVQGKNGRGDGWKALGSILTARNNCGHDLQPVTEPKAKALLEDENLVGQLKMAATGCAAFLALPLVVFESVHGKTGKRFGAVTLLLMGDGQDPIPMEIELLESIEQPGYPYVAGEGSILCLAPWGMWLSPQGASRAQFFLIHRIREGSIELISVQGEHQKLGAEEHALAVSILDGCVISMEKCATVDGLTLEANWDATLTGKLHAIAARTSPVPWDAFVPESLHWFGVRLGADSLETAKQAITEKLLDGNTSVDSLTLGQLAVLFGSRQEVQRRVGRVIVDLRAAGTSDNRWRDRVEVSDNVVIALRTTVEFLAKHIGVDGITIDGLKATSGTADYLAVREAVVNVLMHQDYSDRSAAAQIEVRQEDLSIFNPGKALVGQAGIDAGGKSQSRNPLIAKAMRLIGFAELAGSGLRAVRTAWRTAQRRAPKFMTNAEQNTFEVLLDWRPLEPDEDAFWKKHLGARVTKRQAKLLSSACQKRRLTCQLASEVTAASESESASDLGYLCRQMLLVRDGDWYAPSERAVLIEKGRVTS